MKCLESKTHIGHFVVASTSAAAATTTSCGGFDETICSTEPLSSSGLAIVHAKTPLVRHPNRSSSLAISEWRHLVFNFCPASFLLSLPTNEPILVAHQTTAINGARPSYWAPSCRESGLSTSKEGCSFGQHVGVCLLCMPLWQGKKRNKNLKLEL